MPEYCAKWQVLILDDFNDPESVHDMRDLVFPALSMDAAECLASQLARVEINQHWPDRTHGTFIEHVVSITSETGEVRHLRKPLKLDNYPAVPCAGHA